MTGSNTTSSIEVKISNNLYQIECRDDEKEQLQSAVEYLQEQILQAQKASDGAIYGEKLLSITALNIANDLLNARQILSENKNTMHKHINRIQEQLSTQNTNSANTQETSSDDLAAENMGKYFEGSVR
ncbi:MAG: cell division protein ZapA [Candidatus Oxydemutatoraceae bacterium WSBS_2016_MAG_OTU14]